MLTGSLYDNNYSAGSSGDFLTSTGSGMQWASSISPTSLTLAEGNIFVGNAKGKMVAAAKEQDLKSQNKELDSESVESYQITFRRPNYKDNVDILRMTMTTDGDGIKADFATLRYERFVGLVKEWSFKDENDHVIPATRANIDKLHPEIANAVMDALDEALDTI